MPKRSPLTLAEVADSENLHHAFWRAAQGKRMRPEVKRFELSLAPELERLCAQIISERVKLGSFSRFQIFDPKPRWIAAPCFRDRVLHHALMAQMGPWLERAMIVDSFACRSGKGSSRAVLRAQQHLRRFPWLVKLDIRQYFASIAHDRLSELLERKFRNAGVLRLCGQILQSGSSGCPGRGLPIGALTSQHFANLYLTPLDRFAAEQCGARAHVRYMDDGVYSCESREAARKLRERLRGFVEEDLKLELREARIQRSAQGLPFLGYRIHPAQVRLSRRRKARYRQARRAWERAYAWGWVDAAGLQQGYAAALAITAGAESRGWRQEELRRRAAPEV